VVPKPVELAVVQDDEADDEAAGDGSCHQRSRRGPNSPEPPVAREPGADRRF